LAKDVLLFGQFSLQDDPVPQTFVPSEETCTPGVVSKAGTSIIEFEKYGWHYGWASSRSSCRSLHVFRVFAVVPDGSGNNVRILGSIDSPSFIVASARNERPSKQVKIGEDCEVATAAAARVPISEPAPVVVPSTQQKACNITTLEPQPVSRPSEPLVFTDVLLILQAMHERVRGPDGDEMFSDFTSESIPLLDDDKMSSVSMALSWSAETSLLALERIDAILTRIFGMTLGWHKSLSHDANFYLNLSLVMDEYLQSTEAISLANFADEVRSLLKLKGELLPGGKLGEPQSFSKTDISRLALSAAQAMSLVVTLVDAFVLGGANDVSGLWMQPPHVSDCMAMERSMMGLSFLEQQLLRVADMEVMQIQVLGPHEYNFKRGADRGIFKCNAANFPFIDPFLFPSAHGRPFFVRAHATGLIVATFFDDFKQLKILGRIPNTTDKLHARIVVQQRFPDGWHTILDMATEFDRVG